MRDLLCRKRTVAPILMLALFPIAKGQLLINEFSATQSDRLLVRESGQYPRVGNTTPWQWAEYDDSQWGTGNGPFGFGISGVALGTNVASEVQGVTPTLYLRKSFTADSTIATSTEDLELKVRYNDGFIAFLNGVEIARQRMGFPGMFAYRDQTSYSGHNSTDLITFNLGEAAALLQPGENQLSIQVHNSSTSSGSLLLAADLDLAGGTSVVDGETEWRYFAGRAEPSGGLVDYGLLDGLVQEEPDVPWATTAFDDSTWPTAIGPVGYETSTSHSYNLGVDLASVMQGITPSVYVRTAFTVSQAEADSAFPLSLEVDFDDGMIVYLNGFEVFRDNVGTAGVPTPHTAEANGNHPATGDGGNPQDRSSVVSLAPARDLLQAGSNVLSIQLHNFPITSSDLIGQATLRSTGSNPRVLAAPTDSVRYFVGLEEPSPGEEEGEEDTGLIEEPPDSENDWIEIANPTANAISLAGWSLSDDATDPDKWSFPTGASIPANGYYLVIAGDKALTPGANGTTYPHADFKLSSAGERLLLTGPDGQVIDELTSDFPPQTWRYTYGRQADGQWGYLSLGTPGAMNVGPALGPAPLPPEVSIEGGFHRGPLTVALSSVTPGATIRYTTDGSDPLNGISYSGPVAVSDNTVIRARAFLPDAISSRITTHSYFINEGRAYQSLPAMSLSGDPAKTFYGPNQQNGPSNGEGIFAINGGVYTNGVWGNNGEIEAFNHADRSGRSVEKYGAMEFFPLSGEALRTELGMRVAGSGHTRKRMRITDAPDQPFTSTSTSTTKFEKPSLNIFFRPEFGDRPLDYPFFQNSSVTEFDSLRVRAGKNDWYNPFIKDELMRRLFISTGQVGSTGTFNTLWINGVYKGYYNSAERMREAFMQAQFNSSASWDVQQVNRFSSGDPTHWNEMISYLRTTDLSTPTGYAGVLDYLDVDNYIDYILVNAYAAMGDWPSNNWIASRERTSTGRWRFFVWDAEGSFGFSERSSTHNTFTSELTIADAQTTTRLYIPAIYTLLKESPEFRLRMADRAQKHLFHGGALVTSAVSEIYQELRDEVEPIIEETIGGTFRDSWYTGWIANNRRYDLLSSQLVSEGAWPQVEAPTFNQYGGEISQGFQLTIANPNNGGLVYYTTDGSDPRALGGAIAGSAYAAPIELTDDTRVRARVLQAGVWSPELDYEFTLPFANPTFLPLVSADWTNDSNWSSSPAPYPDEDAVTAVIPAVPGDSRNVNLREPVTIGGLSFELDASDKRSRVRDRSSGNSLTFSDSSDTSTITVTGTGEGYAEIEVEAGTTLMNDLRLEVAHQGGDSDHGALRLRSGWTGSGGLTKAGLGVASLTGEGKAYQGATLVEEGVLRVTAPASPSETSSLGVLPGGQLRLTSGSSADEPLREYNFGAPLTLSGFGRGPEIADDSGNGKLGALRYQPSGNDNAAVITSPVSLAAASGIHVAGSSNQLALTQALTGNAPLTKTGGGLLTLAGDQSNLTYPIIVTSGSLAIEGDLGSPIELSPTATLRGFGSTESITGEGAVILEQTLLSAPASNASHYSFVFGQEGIPDFNNSASAGNASVLLDAAPTGVLALDFYLTGTAASPGAISLGGFVVPFPADLENALSQATVRVFTADSNGTHEFEGQAWTLVPESSLTSVAAELGQSAPFEQIRILELTNGETPPTSFEAWRLANFSAADLVDLTISGPIATPFDDGVSNLLRYALGVPVEESATGYLPRLISGPTGFGLEFPFESGRDDLRIRVEATETLDDWSEATVLFDSATEFPPLDNEAGWIQIDDPRVPVERRFYRIRVDSK